MRYLVLAALVPFLAAGCASWAPVGGTYTSGQGGFSVVLPEGWMRAGTAEPIVITRDGVLLQYIQIERFPVDKEFRHTKKKLAAGMRPLEAAEVIMDDLASDQSMRNVTVLESAPVPVAGHPGFRVVFAFRSTSHVRMKGVYYGVLVGGHFYSLRYTAADRHYFDRDLEAFERLCRTFRIAGG